MNGAETTTTHIGYADESAYNTESFGAIALLSVSRAEAERVRGEMAEIMRAHGLKEFKWKEVRDSRHRKAALSMIRFLVANAENGRLRLDVLVWEKADSRHRVLGRHDTANLERLYYRLFEKVMGERWPNGSTWHLYPDENSALNWDMMQEILTSRGRWVRKDDGTSLLDGPGLYMKPDFQVMAVTPCRSLDESCIGFADLAAGMAAFSFTRFDAYAAWRDKVQNQMMLFGEVDLSAGDQARCEVLSELVRFEDSGTFCLTFSKHRGLSTWNPEKPINFWLYRPQHNADKAPTRSCVLGRPRESRSRG